MGMPEARILIGQAVTYLATAPKSNRAYLAINNAIATVKRTGPLPVPNHLRNAPTDLAESMGHGADYKYPHDYPDHIVEQSHLPDALQGVVFYEPAAHAGEKLIAARMDWWQAQLMDRKKR